MDYDVQYYQKSANKKATVFEVALGGVLSGKLTVPHNTKKAIEFVVRPNIGDFYAKRIAYAIYKKFNQTVSVKCAGNIFEIGKTDAARKAAKKKEYLTDTNWKRYYNFVNKYTGKYRKFDDNGEIGIELCLKKKISEQEALYAISSFIKKYSVIKLTISQTTQDIIDIDKSMSEAEIKSCIHDILSCDEIKPVPEPVLDEPVKTTQIDNDLEPDVTDCTPKHKLDPMILAKALIFFRGPKQTVDVAISTAQRKADELYAYVKLLDTDGKFIANIYPTISQQVYEKRIKEQIHRQLGE